MKFRFLLPAIAAGLFFSSVFVSAEQIRLSDGRYLQGSVDEVREDGFTFKLTESGGKVFLRWNQVDEGLKKRLLNEKDPDEDLNLTVIVIGARLELVSGEVHEGDITRVGAGYKVVNMEFEKGKTFDADEVLEDGFIENIEIDAATIMSSKEVLALAEERREPETARQFYELARIADRLALYEDARDYITLALAASPDVKLESRLTEYETKLTELIRQRQILQEIVNAKALAKKKKFQLALDLLDHAKTDYNPTDLVLDKWQEVFDEVDVEFSQFVIKDYYKRMKPAARAFVKEKRDTDLTVQEALNYARRQMDVDIQELIAETVGSEDPTAIKKRFLARFDLEAEKVVRLSIKKESFGKDGFYQIVKGHLPIAGKKTADSNNNSNRNKDDGRNPRKFPEGRRGGRDGDGVADDQEAGTDFQGLPELPEGLPDDVNDILEKLRKAAGENAKKGESEEYKKVGKQDLSHLKVPSVVPSLVEWWDKASTSTRTNWIMAVYARFGNTMRVVDLDDWNIKFK
ncbi:tetratricopeptide repeat protein [Planctomycetota bacterium]|nr:tetratricopeptide repeat protein [Planctomycetota bacterium]